MLDLQMEALECIETPEMSLGQAIGLGLVGLGSGVLVGVGLAIILT